MATSGNDRRIDYVELTVSDVARSREFYGKVFERREATALHILALACARSR